LKGEQNDVTSYPVLKKELIAFIANLSLIVYSLTEVIPKISAKHHGVLNI